MSRIRYEALRVDGVFQSKQIFQHPTNGARYRVSLNMKTNQYFIKDAASGLVAKEGKHNRPHKLKIAAREALESLGVELEVESRERNKGEN